MRRRLIAVLAVLALGVVGVPLAGAQTVEDDGEGAVTTDLTGTLGGRTIGTVGTAPSNPTALTDLSANLTVTGLSDSTYAVGVLEDLADGFHGWQVTAKVCAPTTLSSDVASLGGADCSDANTDGHGEHELVNAAGTAELPGSSIEMDDRNVTEVLTAGDSGDLSIGGVAKASLPNATEVALSGEQELFLNENQASGTKYSEDYIASGVLRVNPPESGTIVDDTYYGYLVVTLYN